MGLGPSNRRRKLAVVLAWASVAAMVLGAGFGAYWLAETIRIDDRVQVGICVPLGGLVLIVMGTCGTAAWAKLTALCRRSARVFGHAQSSIAYRPIHPIEGHDPWLARIMQDTRSILHDMSHLEAKAEWWPSDGFAQGWLAGLRGRTGRSPGHGLADFSEVNRITRDIWEWVRTVDALAPEQQSFLEERGIQAEKLRETLLADGDFHGRFVAMARLLRRYEEGLFALPTDPFRGMAATHRPGPSPERMAMPQPRAADSSKESPEPSEGTPIEQVYVNLVRTKQSSMRAMAARFARTPDDREDLYQDMLLAIWKALPQFRGEASLTTYAQRIAYSTAVDYARRHRMTMPEIDASDHRPDPEQRIGLSRVGERLHAAVEALPQSLREVMVLHLDGYDYQEIARQTGLGQGNVGARLSRARIRLRRRLSCLTHALPDGTSRP